MGTGLGMQMANMVTALKTGEPVKVNPGWTVTGPTVTAPQQAAATGKSKRRAAALGVSNQLASVATAAGDAKLGG